MNGSCVGLKEVGTSFIPTMSVFPSALHRTRGCLAHPAALIENTDVPAPMKNGPSAGSGAAFPEPAPFCARVGSSGSRGPESQADHVPRQQAGQPPSVEVCVYFSTGSCIYKQEGSFSRCLGLLGVDTDACAH